MTIYHSKIEKKSLDVNELKLDLPKIEPQFMEERTNVLGDTFMKDIFRDIVEQENRAFMNWVEKLGYVPTEFIVERHPMRFREDENGNVFVDSGIRFKIKKDRGVKKR
jgi:hypothetical protein